MSSSLADPSGRTPRTGGAFRIVRLAPGQHGEAAAVLAASHASYPAFRSVFPKHAQRSRALGLFFSATLRDAIAHGTVEAARTEDGFVGVAAWLPPGGFPWTLGRKLRATGTFARVLTAAPGSFGRFTRYGANAEEAHPLEPHWYLVVLGVRPEWQGRGVGGGLLRLALQRADRDELPCYLETSDPANVALYGRFGFEVVDDALQLVPGGPPHVAMRRPAPDC